MLKLIPLSKKIALTYILLLIFLSISKSVSAHRINVYCWVQGKKIICESAFSDGEPAGNSTMKVLAYPENKLLLKGKSNEKGKFSFTIPQKAQKNSLDLKVLCQADMGHQSFWIVRARDFASTKKEAEKQTQEQPDQSKPVSGLALKEIRNIVSQEVEKGLGPVKRELSRMQNEKVTLQDIISGIGYILGLMGIALYFKSRGK